MKGRVSFSQQEKYNRNDIKNWKSKLETLPGDIDSYQKKIQTDEAEQELKKQQLDELKKNKIKPEEKLLEQIVAKIDLLTLPAVLQSHERGRDDLIAKMADLTSRIATLHTEMDPIKTRIKHDELLLNLKAKQENIQRLENRIGSLLNSSQTYENELRTANRILEDEARSFAEIDREMDGLKKRRREAEHEKDNLFRAREALQVSVSSSYTSSSGGYSSSAGGGFSSYVGTMDGSGYETSVSSSVTVLAHTEHLIAEYNQKIFLKENELSSLNGLMEVRRHAHLEAERRHQSAERIVGNLDSKLRDCRRDTRAAENERDELQASILSQASLAEREEAKVSSVDMLRDRLSQENRSLQPLERHCQSLRSESLGLESSLESEINKIYRISNRLEACNRINKNFVSSDSLDQLRERKQVQDRVLEGLYDSRAQLGLELAKLEKIIADDKKSKKDLESELSKHRSRAYLFTLENNPLELLNFFYQKVQKHREQFELDHAAKQSVSARTCLANLNVKMNYLMPGPISVDSKEYDKNQIRQLYYHVCGLLRDLMVLHEDRQIEVMLSGMLKDELIDLDEAEIEYVQLEKQLGEKMPGVSFDNLFESESRDFELAKQNFQSMLDTMLTQPVGKVRDLGIDLLNRINLKEKEAEKPGSEPFDRHLYTSLLVSAVKLIPDGANDVKQNEFRRLALQQPDDGPSIWNKIGGVALMLLGAVVAAAGALAIIFGLPIPIAPPLYVGVPMVVAGAATFLGGVGLFARGCRASTSEKLEQFVVENERVALRSLNQPETEGWNGPGSYNAHQAASKAF